MSATTMQPSDSMGDVSAASRWHPRTIIRTGVIGGWVAIYLCLVGIVPVFNERPLIVGVISSARRPC